MKRSILVVLFLAATVFIFIGAVSLKSKSPQPLPQPLQIKKEQLEELKIVQTGKAVSEGVISEKYAFKTKDNSVIQIGTERHSPPKPYLMMDKWDGEISLKVRMPFETGDNPAVIGNKIRYSTVDKPVAANPWQRLNSMLFPQVNASEPRVDIDIYPKPADEQNEDGGVEFDTIFYEKPSINRIDFPIETANLDFFYQPPLTPEEIAEGANRPENVVGSYAVYHSGNPINYVGGKEYKTGKAFHIYRPKVTDASGKEVWGELNIDEAKGLLTITIDQTWLDKAVYPVTVDPTFGYTTAGGTANTFGVTDGLVGMPGTPSGDGTVQSVSWYGYGTGTNVKAVLVLSSSLTIVTNGVGNAVALTALPIWNTSSFSVNPTVTAVEYFASMVYSSNATFYYDVGSGNQRLSDPTNSYGTPINPTDGTRSATKYSMYATYTQSGSSTNFQGVDMEGININ